MAYTQAYLTQAITASATISSGTADSVYGLTKLYDGHAGVPFRFTVTTGGYVEIDFGTATTIGGVALINHNLTAGATVTLKGGASANPSTLTVTLTYRQYDTWSAVSTSTSYRYWRLAISETNTSNTEIGELVLGTLSTFSRAHNYGHGQAVSRGMASHETELGVRYEARRWKRREWTLNWRNLTTAQLAEIQALDTAVDGSRLPFVWIPDTSTTECYYVRKQTQQEWSNTTGEHWDAALQLREETRGSTITR